ncbi:FHA domain-containing protein [Lachnospiraceae bacterium 45-W7]
MAQKNRMKKIRLLLWGALLIAVPVLAGKTVKVAAIARYDDPVGIIVGYTAEEERVFLSGAVAVKDGDMKCLITTLCDNPEAEIALVYMNSLEKLDFSFLISQVEREDLEQEKVTMWDVSKVNDIPEEYFAEVSFPVQNEKAALAYWTSDGEDVRKVVTEVTIKELQEDKITVEGISEGVVYPAPILNEAGYVVAVAANKEEVYHFGASEESFYGTGGENSGGEEDDAAQGDDSQVNGTDGGDNQGNTQEGENSQGAGKNGENNQGGAGNADSGQEDSGNSGESQGNTGNSSQGDAENTKESNLKTVLIGIAGTGAVACVAAALVILTRKSSDSGNGSGSQDREVQQGGYQQPFQRQDIYQQPYQREEDATVPLDGDVYYDQEAPESFVRQDTQLWLAARGGYMDGRVYAIAQSGITIGRDVSNVVNYPKDVAGVSRTHAKLFWENGRLKLMDCNSSYGTFLKGKGKLSPMNPVEVKTGDVFYIAEKNNRFEIRK